MKRETVLEKLNGVQDGDYGQFLDWLMGENGSDINRAKGSIEAVKDELSSTKAQLEALRKEKEEAEKAGLTKEQLLERQIKEYEAKKAELDMAQNRITAKSKLTEAGFTGDEAEKRLDRFVTADAEATEASLEVLLSVFESRRESIKADTKKSLIDGTPRPKQGTAPNKGVSKEQFAGMTYFERAALYEENPELYKQLVTEE